MIWPIALLPHNNHCYHPHQYFTDHFDTSIGSKQESSSYVAIAQTIQTDPSDILFVSDNVKGTSMSLPLLPFLLYEAHWQTCFSEIKAAEEAGFQTVISDRLGNVPLTEQDKTNRRVVTSFSQIPWKTPKI